MTLRVVVDTNVVLSALIFEAGQVAWLRDAWARSLCLPLVSTETAGELVLALAYPKFKLSVEEREELLGDYLPYCERVGGTSVAGLPRCKDPDDQKFLELAAAGRAAMLITGDKALLALAGSCPFRIATPAEAKSAILREMR